MRLITSTLYSSMTCAYKRICAYKQNAPNNARVRNWLYTPTELTLWACTLSQEKLLENEIGKYCSRFPVFILHNFSLSKYMIQDEVVGLGRGWSVCVHPSLPMLCMRIEFKKIEEGLGQVCEQGSFERGLYRLICVQEAHSRGSGSMLPQEMFQKRHALRSILALHYMYISTV